MKQLPLSLLIHYCNCIILEWIPVDIYFQIPKLFATYSENPVDGQCESFTDTDEIDGDPDKSSHETENHYEEEPGGCGQDSWCAETQTNGPDHL